MKTAISIPDDLFDEADALVKRMKTSRSELYSRAVREFVARHSPDRVTELDSLYPEDLEPDEFVVEASRRALERSEW
jgi:hypothetical protein